MLDSHLSLHSYHGMVVLGCYWNELAEQSRSCGIKHSLGIVLFLFMGVKDNCILCILSQNILPM